MEIPVPLELRRTAEAFCERLEQLPSRVNEYGYDPFGMQPASLRAISTPVAFLYRYWFRVDARGAERIPPGRLLVVANHAGNTLPMDGVMLAAAMLMEGMPPRLPRAMAESYLPRIPWWSELIHRAGAVVGTPENCRRLLENEEAIMVFPEGARGFIKPYSKRYQLQRFGTGFARMALENKTPVLPVGIVGSEEQSPGLIDSKSLARMVGAPAFPVTWFFPWLGVPGFLPLPVKYRIRFGEPIWLEGDPQGDDEAIRSQVERVRERISGLVDEALAERTDWFR